MTRCKYFPKVICLTGDTLKCEEKYNEYNAVCPFLKVYGEDLKIPSKIVDGLPYYEDIKVQLKSPPHVENE
jgi:hypothetical protein